MSLDRKDTYCPLPRRRWEKERKHQVFPPNNCTFIHWNQNGFEQCYAIYLITTGALRIGAVREPSNHPAIHL